MCGTVHAWCACAADNVVAWRRPERKDNSYPQFCPGSQFSPSKVASIKPNLLMHWPDLEKNNPEGFWAHEFSAFRIVRAGRGVGHACVTLMFFFLCCCLRQTSTARAPPTARCPRSRTSWASSRSCSSCRVSLACKLSRAGDFFCCCPRLVTHSKN